MQLYAIVSDIHGNYEALKAVAKDARTIAHREMGKRDAVTFVSLGDVVDYGPQPNECIRWLQRNAQYAIQGNHDRIVAQEEGLPHGINNRYWPVTLWNRTTLQPRHKKLIRTWAPSFASLPPPIHKFTLVHSSIVRDDQYIESGSAAQESIQAIQTPYCLFGHTHIQGYYVEERAMPCCGLACSREESEPLQQRFGNTGGWRSVLVGEWHPLLPERKMLLNPGSVGQPRPHGYFAGAGVKHNKLAEYLLLRLVDAPGESMFQFRRVHYNRDKTIAHLRAITFAPDLASLSSLATDFEHAVGYGIDQLEQKLHELIETSLIPRLSPQ